jgi:hypothetical protein
LGLAPPMAPITVEAGKNVHVKLKYSNRAWPG